MKDVVALCWAAYQGDLMKFSAWLLVALTWMKRITMVEHASIWRHRKARRGGPVFNCTQYEPKPESLGWDRMTTKRHDHKSIVKLLKKQKKENKNV